MRPFPEFSSVHRIEYMQISTELNFERLLFGVFLFRKLLFREVFSSFFSRSFPLMQQAFFSGHSFSEIFLPVSLYRVFSCVAIFPGTAFRGTLRGSFRITKLTAYKEILRFISENSLSGFFSLEKLFFWERPFLELYPGIFLKSFLGMYPVYKADLS